MPQTEMHTLFLAGWNHAGEFVRLPKMFHVKQSDWNRPLRGDWMIQLEEAVLDAPAPVELVAYGLGCILVAAWAAHSHNTQRVVRAILIEPDDSEREDRRTILKSWSPIPMQRLPFPSTLRSNNGNNNKNSSTQNPYCSMARAQFFAQSWGSVLHGN